MMSVQKRYNDLLALIISEVCKRDDVLRHIPGAQSRPVLLLLLVGAFSLNVSSAAPSCISSVGTAAKIQVWW